MTTLTNTFLFPVSRALCKMQLDIDMSPPANIMTFRLTLTHMTFDLYHVLRYCGCRSNRLGDMNYCPVNFYLVWFFVTTDRRAQSNA